MLTYEQIEELSFKVRDEMARRIEQGESIVPCLFVFPDTDKNPKAAPTIVDVSPLQTSGRAKDILAQVINSLLDKTDVLMVMHVTEAWVRKLQKPSDEEVKRISEEGLHDNPEGRSEALNLHIYTPDCQWICTSEIERHPDRVTRAGLISLNGPSGMTYEGRFVRERRLQS